MDEELRNVGLGWAVTLLSAIFGVLAVMFGIVGHAAVFFLIAAGGLTWLVYCFWCYHVPYIPDYIKFWKEQATTWTR